MTPPVLTADLGSIPLDWATETRNTEPVTHRATANIAPVALGGLWRGAVITAEDIQASRKELWSSLESSE